MRSASCARSVVKSEMSCTSSRKETMAMRSRGPTVAMKLSAALRMKSSRSSTLPDTSSRRTRLKGARRRLHVLDRARLVVLDDGEVFRGEAADGAALPVGDARLKARERAARGRADVEGVAARAEGRLGAARRQGLGVLADELRRDAADGVRQVLIAAADDGARGLGQRALAQVGGDAPLVGDAEEDDAARGLKVEFDEFAFARLLRAEAPRDFERAAALLALPFPARPRCRSAGARAST